MTDHQRRERFGPRGPDGPLLRAAAVSLALHAAAIALLVMAPHRLRSAPPVAYTVEIVDPGAVGGKLLAGPIGGGAAARRAPPARPEPPPPEPPREEPPVVAKAEPARPEPPVEDADTVPLALAKETARPTPRAQPTARPVATARPSPSVRAQRASPTAAPTPARGAAAAARATATAHGGERRVEATPLPPDLDAQLAKAIADVGKREEKSGAGESGARGGMGGTERTLDRPPGIGGEGPGGGGTLRGLEFVVYYNQMLSRIKETWAYVGTRADLRVTVRFSILESGEITNIRLVERSGDPGYDASVERAVKRASPLPPPPEAYRKDFADVELTFRPADLSRPTSE